MNHMNARIQGLLLFGLGIVGCALVGLNFLLKLTIIYLSFLFINQGLRLLNMPTLNECLQKCSGIFYRYYNN